MLNISKSITFKILCLTIFGLSQSLVHSIVTTLEGKNANGEALPKIEVEWQYHNAHGENWAMLRTIPLKNWVLKDTVEYRSPEGLKATGYDLSKLPSNANGSTPIPSPCYVRNYIGTKDAFIEKILPRLAQFKPTTKNPNPLPADGSVGNGFFDSAAASKTAAENFARNIANELSSMEPGKIAAKLDELEKISPILRNPANREKIQLDIDKQLTNEEVKIAFRKSIPSTALTKIQAAEIASKKAALAAKDQDIANLQQDIAKDAQETEQNKTQANETVNTQEVDSSGKSNSSKYAWYGAGALALAGTVAVANHLINKRKAETVDIDEASNKNKTSSKKRG